MTFEQAIFDAGGEIYEVGGTVRDRLLNWPLKDEDLLVTGVPLDKLSNILRPFGEVAFVGRSFGVLKFGKYDIAIPRKEVSTGEGHRDFKVIYDHTLPVEVDLGRRDFTINAMAWNVRTKELIDPFGGKTDLKNRILRQVFLEAFPEDPLRLLRAVQFSARFDLEIEPATLESMIKHAKLIETVSSERVAEEIKKLFLSQRPSRGFDIMDKTGILPSLFPEISATKGIKQDKGHDVYEHTMIVLDATASDKLIDHVGDLELMFAALFHDVGKAKTARFVPEQQRVAFFGHQLVSKKIAMRRMDQLKVTTLGINPENVLTMIENHMFETKSFFPDKAIRRFVAKIGKDLIMKLIDFRIADNRGGKYPAGVGGVLKLKKRILEEMAKKPPFGAKDLKVTGHDLMEIGVKAGPLMGKMIKHLVELVLDEPEQNTKEHLLKIAKEMYDKEETTDQKENGRKEEKKKSEKGLVSG